MQRLLALLLLVVFCSGFSPCADEPIGVACEDGVDLPCNHEDDDHNEEDDCSPFCACACCSVPVNTNVYQTIITEPLLPQLAVLSPESLCSSPDFDIWQPPKI